MYKQSVNIVSYVPDYAVPPNDLSRPPQPLKVYVS